MIDDDPDPFDTEVSWLQRTALDDGRLLSRLSWGELRAFLTAAKLGSVNRAASYLGRDKRRVSQQIDHLQDMIGSQIVVKSRVGITLTPRGERLAQFLVRFDRDLSSLASDLAVESSQAEGRVTLTISDGLGMVFLVPALRTFSRSFPRVQLVLKTPLNYRRLSENGTDMMLAFNEDPSADVTSLRLGRLHLLPMASQAYVEQYGLPNLGNVADQLFVDSDQYSSRSGLYGSWQDLVARGRVAHLCDTSMSYAMMVKCGLGIGLLSNYATIEPSLIPLDLNVHVQLQLHLVVLKERLRSRPVRLAFEFFGDLFSSENRWFGADVTFSHPFTGAPPREEPVLFDLRRVESD